MKTLHELRQLPHSQWPWSWQLAWYSFLVLVTCGAVVVLGFQPLQQRTQEAEQQQRNLQLQYQQMQQDKAALLGLEAAITQWQMLVRQVPALALNASADDVVAAIQRSATFHQVHVAQIKPLKERGKAAVRTQKINLQVQGQFAAIVRWLTSVAMLAQPVELGTWSVSVMRNANAKAANQLRWQGQIVVHKSAPSSLAKKEDKL